MYRLKYRKKARNYLARLPVKTKTVIINKLHELCLDPDSPNLNIDTLKGGEGFRLRIGKYRILYTRDDNYLIIEVVKIRPRGDVYKA
jgi:mRNA interferase RelE/StbE